MSDLQDAIENDPAGQVCTFCKGPNTHADDCGWWYLHPEPSISGYTCKRCYDGSVGQRHRARYGVGER